MKINTLNDIEKIVADQPVDTKMYIDGYENLVACNLLTLFREKGFQWGDDLPVVSMREFWDCWTEAEVK